MEFNRNRFFLLGLLLLLLGVEFRVTDSFVLNEKATKYLAAHAASPPAPVLSVVAPDAPLPRKVVHLPPWLGYSLISLGSVLILHAFGMKKAGG